MPIPKPIHHILFHRHLLWEFLRRDIEARYIGSAMGFFWSVVNPLVLLVVYWFVFGLIMKKTYSMLGGEETAGGFAFYIFCGLLPWYAFQESLIRSTTSIVDNAHLIKQVRFPAKVLPAFITLSAIVNQLIGTLIFLVAILIAKHCLPWTLVFLPIVLIFEMVLFFGLGLLFSTLNTYFRDIAPLVSIGSMLLMWSTPMLYLMKDVPDYLQPLIYANPLTSLVIIHHDIVLHGQVPSLIHWVVFLLFSLAALALGYPVFTKHHNNFADML